MYATRIFVTAFTVILEPENYPRWQIIRINKISKSANYSSRRIIRVCILFIRVCELSESANLTRIAEFATNGIFDCLILNIRSSLNIYTVCELLLYSVLVCLQPEVELKGPNSPLEMKLYSLVHSCTNKDVRVEWNSVNSVLLDSDPADPHERSVILDQSHTMAALGLKQVFRVIMCASDTVVGNPLI